MGFSSKTTSTEYIIRIYFRAIKGTDRINPIPACSLSCPGGGGGATRQGVNGMDPTVMVIDPLQRQARYIIILRYTKILTEYLYQDADKDIGAYPCNPPYC